MKFGAMGEWGASRIFSTLLFFVCEQIFFIRNDVFVFCQIMEYFLERKGIWAVGFTFFVNDEMVFPTAIYVSTIF